MTIAMVFPGQGSQSQGMQADLAAEFPVERDTYNEAGEALGYDLWQLVQEGPVEKLAETVVTQPAMLTAGYASWLAWCEAGGAQPEQMAGHSLGEYTALVCAGAISFSDALKVVKKRSELMQAAVPVGEGAQAMSPSSTKLNGAYLTRVGVPYQDLERLKPAIATKSS